MTTDTMTPEQLAKTMFGGFDQAKASVDSNWEREGNYLCKIDRVKVSTNRKGQKGFFVEKTVIHVIDDNEGDGHKVHDSISHAMWTHHESFLGNVKACLASVLGMAPTQVTEADVFSVIGDDQPLSGTVIENKNRTIQTKAGNPFTLVRYVREVPAAELIDVLSDEVKEFYFPDDMLTQMAEFEAEAATV